MITGTYNLTVNPQWINVQQQQVFLECDTTLAPVTINLFEIAELNRFWGVKIIISDANNNAGTNNITINASGSDTVDDDTTNQIVINTNGSSVSFQVASETQWLAIESVVAGGGGGSSNPFGAFFDNSPSTVNIIDALEGTSIPNGATDSYIKTIPLNAYSNAITTALVVFNAFETFAFPNNSQTGNGYGVTSGGCNPLAGQGALGYPMVEACTRLLVVADYSKTLRPQSLGNVGAAQEVDENGTSLNSGTNPNYSEIGGTLIGYYVISSNGIGYTSDDSALTQNNSVIKSAYLDTSVATPNLVLLMKKTKATVSVNWASLEMNVYDLSA
jgi:hypothetical protein